MTDQGPDATRKPWALYAPFLPVILLVLVPLAFALTQGTTLERDMRIAATQNMLWVTSQTQMEIMALTQAAGRADPDPAEVARRFDLTVARLTLMQQGPQARYLAEIGHPDVAGEMLSALLLLDPMANELDADLVEAIHLLGLDLQPRINRLANIVMTTDWDRSAARLDAFRQTQRLVISAVAFALLAAVAISWILLRNQRRLHLAEVENLRAVNLLEQERDVSAMYRDFAAIVSHQMRTPLSLIDSSMHRLTRMGEAVTARDVAERREIVGDAVQRLTRLVDTVLLLAKLDTDQLQARFAPLPMDRVAEALIEEVRPRHPGREISLSTTQAPLLAMGDSHLVGHILDNLLSNALKYSPPDSPVELRVFAQGAEIACAITDRGPGIAPKDRARLFERYYRGEAQSGGDGTGAGNGSEGGPVSGPEYGQPARQPAGSGTGTGTSTGMSTGTGLGLALARELAEVQRGRITFETWPGRGSVFTLWLQACRTGRDNEGS